MELVDRAVRLAQPQRHGRRGRCSGGWHHRMLPLAPPLPHALLPTRALTRPLRCSLQESLLVAARQALEHVRQRDPADSRLRQQGPSIQAYTTDTVSSSAGGGSAAAQKPSTRGLTSFVWESDLDEEDDEDGWGGGGGGGGGGGVGSSPSAGGGGGVGSSPSAGGGGGGSGGAWAAGSGDGGQSWSQAGVDSWFGDKVDTGPVALRKARQPMQAVGEVRPGPGQREAAASHSQ